MKLPETACLLILIVSSSLTAARATTYYISPTGKDNNNGTATTTPWKTLAKVNGHTFSAGNQVLFQSGQTFTAPSNSDALIIKGAGTSTNPIVYGIYGGTTPAIISQTSASRNGVTFSSSTSYVTLENLQVAGPFAWSATKVGAATPYGIYLQGSSSKALTGTTIEDVTVHNFGGSGIRTPEDQKVANLNITYTQVYAVGDAGIRIGDDGDTQGAQLHTNIYIGHCYVYDTSGYNANEVHHGDGILVQCAKTATIEYCDVHDTALAFGANATGGPVGIWYADVASGIIQFCESYSSSDGALHTDGDGIDLDGGSQGCIVQYCYTHDNDGAGILQAHWATASEKASETINNTIRYNILVNDCRHSGQADLSYWSENAAATLNNVAYNNLVVQAWPGATNACLDQENTDGTSASPARIYNNIFVADNTHELANAKNGATFIIQNNIWWSLNNTFTYSGGSLAVTDPAGRQADPMINGGPASLLTAPTVGYANIDNMQSFLTAEYQELTGSAAVDTGLNLTLAPYGSHNVGTQDFFGTSIPQNTSYDIGPYERVQPGPAVANCSFETPSVGTGAYTADPTGGTWTFASQAGIQSNGSTLGAPSAPNGMQAAYLMGISGVNGTISQTVSFPAAGAFVVTLQAAAPGTGNAETFYVQIDGTTVGTCTPAAGSFGAFATNAFAISAAGSHTLSFVGTGTATSATAFIDNVDIAVEP